MISRKLYWHLEVRVSSRINKAAVSSTILIEIMKSKFSIVDFVTRKIVG
jgi:hypothetical protein